MHVAEGGPFIEKLDRKKSIAHFRDALERADLAFWAVIAQHYPQAKRGDFRPEETAAWSSAMETAVLAWLANNYPGDIADLVEEVLGISERRQGTIDFS